MKPLKFYCGCGKIGPSRSFQWLFKRLLNRLYLTGRGFSCRSWITRYTRNVFVDNILKKLSIKIESCPNHPRMKEPKTLKFNLEE